MRLRRISLAMVAVVAATMAPSPANAAPVDRTGLQQALDDSRTEGVPGALAEVRDEHGTWRGTTGVAELGGSRPVPVAGRFRIGSITKTFVATVVMQLAGQHRLGLDDPVERWLPGMVPGGDRITLRQLLSHTSGLYDYTRDWGLPVGFLDIRWRTWSPQELIGLAMAHPPLFDPGVRFSYSNTNYTLLGLVVQAVTGQSYATNVERRIIRPLGLHGTSVPGTETRIRGPHAHGYIPVAEGDTVRTVDITAMNPSALWASGDIISTTADLNRFFTALVHGDLVGDAELQAMLPPPGAPYGLGLRRLDLPCGITAYGNDGDAPGYSSQSYVTEDTRRTITVSHTWGTQRPSEPTALTEKALCD
jgi:D-alanyl-D-alanine carboxypeptidase